MVTPRRSFVAPLASLPSARAALGAVLPTPRTAFAALLAAVVALLLVPVGTATAHDQLTGSDPEEGSTVEAPEELVLTFSGQIAELGVLIEVTDPESRSVVEGDPVVDGFDVTQGLEDDLLAGNYEVLWRVTSEDGHPISGEFTFTVEAAEPAPTEETTDEATEEATTKAAATDGATEEATTEAAATDEATEEATDEPTEEAADGDDASVTAEPEESEGGGMPTWAWVVIGAAVLGVLGLLGRTWARGRE